jgi:hypothetical protein
MVFQVVCQVGVFWAGAALMLMITRVFNPFTLNWYG